MKPVIMCNQLPQELIQRVKHQTIQTIRGKTPHIILKDNKNLALNFQ